METWFMPLGEEIVAEPETAGAVRLQPKFLEQTISVWRMTLSDRIVNGDGSDHLERFTYVRQSEAEALKYWAALSAFAAIKNNDVRVVISASWSTHPSGLVLGKYSWLVVFRKNPPKPVFRMTHDGNDKPLSSFLDIFPAPVTDPLTWQRFFEEHIGIAGEARVAARALKYA